MGKDQEAISTFGCNLLMVWRSDTLRSLLSVTSGALSNGLSRKVGPLSLPLGRWQPPPHDAGRGDARVTGFLQERARFRKGKGRDGRGRIPAAAGSSIRRRSDST